MAARRWLTQAARQVHSSAGVGSAQRGNGGSGADPRRAFPRQEEQKWTTKTMIALSTSVGALVRTDAAAALTTQTFYLGAMQGYSQGKALAFEETHLAPQGAAWAAGERPAPRESSIQV